MLQAVVYAVFSAFFMSSKHQVANNIVVFSWNMSKIGKLTSRTLGYTAHVCVHTYARARAHARAHTLTQGG